MEKKKDKENREKESRILRLAKPVRKGILGIIFSRTLLIALLILLQLAVLAAVYWEFRGYLAQYAWVRTAFITAVVLYLFNNGMDNSVKLTWMVIIAVFPLPGALLLLYTQADAGHRRIRKQTANLAEATMDAIPQDPSALAALGDGSGTDDLCRYAGRSGCFPVFGGTESEYFPLGEDMFDALLAELEGAEKYIYLEYFIIEEGYMWGRVLDILTRKAAAGVDVRVMYDGMCEITHLPRGYWRRLEQHGIRAKTFAPVTPLISTRYNYRDHRKLCVIDGRAAFTGGVNLSDEYMNRTHPYGHWKDTAVLLRGPAARSFALMFLQMWNIGEETPDFAAVAEETPPVPGAAGFVMPYGDCPLSGSKVGESVYIDMLYRADRYVHIMTPYLILDGKTQTALKFAAERGIDVKLILPGVPDKKAAYALAKSHYRALTEAGVGIYEYAPGFVHAKTAVSDGVKAVVGSINLDYRSLYHHFECAAYLYKTPCVADIEADFQKTLAQCRAVTAETIDNEKWTYRAAGWLLKLIAPLM